jgi:hypothetical protein
LGLEPFLGKFFGKFFGEFFGVKPEALLGSDGEPPATALKRAGNTFPHPTTKLC